MSASPSERGTKRRRLRSAHDHNKAAVQGDTPGNSEATPGNGPALPHTALPAATPALLIIPSSPAFTELATVLFTVMVWAVMAWRAKRGERP